MFGYGGTRALVPQNKCLATGVLEASRCEMRTRWNERLHLPQRGCGETVYTVYCCCILYRHCTGTLQEKHKLLQTPDLWHGMHKGCRLQQACRTLPLPLAFAEHALRVFPLAIQWRLWGAFLISFLDCEGSELLWACSLKVFR